MGTRSGSIDPSIVTYLAKKENLKLEEIDELLNKKSGAYGVSGVSPDFRDKRAILALESNAYLTAQKIAAYMAVLRRSRCNNICRRCSEKMGLRQEKEFVNI